MLYLPATLRCQQNINFHHITTLNGLSDNSVVNASLDRQGFLWICTTEGLNKYDGRGMETYYKEEYPALGNNNIREVVCDNRNRLWIRSFGGHISMLDEKRNSRPIHVIDGGDTIELFNIIQTKTRGIVLFRGNKQYYSPGGDETFVRWPFNDDSIFNQRLYYYSQLSADEVIWTGTDELFIMDYAAGKIIYRKKIPGITSTVALNKTELYVTTNTSGGLYHLDLNTGALQPVPNLRDQYGKPIFSSLQMIRKMADNRMIIASAFAGIYLFDPTKHQLIRYEHDPMDKRSVAGNNYSNLITDDSSGYVMIASKTGGLSYFNVHDKPANWVSAITDRQGQVFDGYINSILQAKEAHLFWLGGYNQLMKWNRQTGKAVFFDYGVSSKGEPNRGNEEILSLAQHTSGKLWVGTASNGIAVLNAAGKYVKEIAVTVPGGNKSINHLLKSGDSLWAATGAGLWCINAKTDLPISIGATNLLHQLDSTNCGKLWRDSRNRLWIGTARKGAFCYDPGSQTLRQFAAPAPGASMEVFAFEEDRNGLLYLGTRAGLQVYKEDLLVATFTRLNGLRADRCENLLKDAKGRIWIDNHTCVICYDPVDQSFRVYDEKSGLSPYGFRPRSSCITQDGSFFLGNEAGFSFFHPDSIQRSQTSVRLTLNNVQHDGTNITINGRNPIELPSYDNLVVNFSAIDLDQSRTIYYRYRLDNFDKQWISETNITNLRYNGLPVGNYRLQLLASNDGLNWVEPDNPLRLVIKPAYWQTTGFRFGAALLLAIFLYFLLKQRERMISLKAEERARVEEMRSQALQYQLEIEQVINYFAKSLSGLHTVDEVLWDVVKTCISQLGFQDCVIYLYDKNRDLLVQKAAYGPKNIDYTDIYNRIEVARGSGIVGHVAETLNPIIIADTSKDARYIPDDAVRLSEIAIPLIGSTGLVGVIDSEHTEVNFYTNKHLQILTAIGTMVVNKTEQLHAEADSRYREVEMARLQRDVATLQLTATRAQMNPHFIFNALNSVQQYILQGNTDEANKYLSKFSRLQREILNHCDRPFISLQKETEMLRIYLQLEQLRFNGNFEFDLSIKEDIDPEEIRIPPMILQPFIENAIWHGLMPKDGHKTVTVCFSMNEETDLLNCFITDNGIGRKAAAENKVNNLQDTNYVSKGLSLVYKRLELLQQQMGKTFSSTINDMTDANGEPTGTRVEVTMFTGF